jgi:hypothetical protein
MKIEICSKIAFIFSFFNPELSAFSEWSYRKIYNKTKEKPLPIKGGGYDSTL